ncbi:hypothetical protein WN55_04270 [Dufourea novaeangliae]|uniref:Uncharacterized protein n=1 Tax=Dufourea novaeangliae TaxID=178035 RepID=A0A154PMI5_DUFNO|nr:hypothetical protein WN55_04270 [Dufourea novaeangliae]
MERWRAERVRRREDVERKSLCKITFWNEAGLKNKDKEFWKGLELTEMHLLLCMRLAM